MDWFEVALSIFTLGCACYGAFKLGQKVGTRLGLYLVRRWEHDS